MEKYTHKVQYYETDQMSIVHHSNYIRWFEEARVDFLDKIGVGLDILEQKGFTSPVVSVECSYVKPTKFGESVYIEVSLENFDKVRFQFSYVIKNTENDEIKAYGKTTHCFIDDKKKVISLKRSDKEDYCKIIDGIGK